MPRGRAGGGMSGLGSRQGGDVFDTVTVNAGKQNEICCACAGSRRSICDRRGTIRIALDENHDDRIVEACGARSAAR